MEDINRLGIEILMKAREWLYTRRRLRRMLDSKTASKAQVDTSKRAYNKACDELEKLSGQLEASLKKQGIQMPTQKKLDFPWRKMLGIIAMGAKAVEEAVAEKGGKPSRPEVIDVPGEDA